MTMTPEHRKHLEDTRESYQRAVDGVSGMLGDDPASVIEENARYRKALEYIAHFDREYLDLCATIHHDMNGVARKALLPDAPHVFGKWDEIYPVKK